jgi:hypothetical protein
MQQSKIFSLNWADALKSLLIAIGTPVLVAVERIIDSGKMDFSWKSLAMIGIGGGVTYLVKNYFSPPATTPPTNPLGK